MKGFTLIELIIYIAILSMILVFTSGYAWDVIYGKTKTTAFREVQQNARFVMEKMTRTIRDGSDPSTIYTVMSNVLYENSTALTTENVKVTNLQFTSIGGGYTVELTVEYNNLDNRPEYDASVDVESSAMPRQ